MNNKLNTLTNITTPAYIADIAAIKRNMALAGRIKDEAGIKMVLATKAFAMPAVFPYMVDTLDGTTASGLYEARLGAEHFGKEVHTYSPAFREADLRECMKFSSHIYFNSVEQLKKLSPIAKECSPTCHIGLRVNPGLSLVQMSELYDPSAPNSRFGVQADELTPDVLALVDILHFHNLCENPAEDSARLMEHISERFGEALKHVSEINLGGGHFYTRPNYNVEKLINALKKFQTDNGVRVTLEPGGAHVHLAGYLAAEILDIFGQDTEKKVILDASASTHMPDVLEVPYRPDIIGSGEAGKKKHSYILGGNTCMTGDVIGKYSFDEELKIGDKLFFTDMMQYSFVKNTTFNGVPLPDLALLHEDGSYEVVQEFGYEDFARRLGA